ncbi:MAG: hypothetical protein MZW92_51270 [Comamonadaceae bacterium]|nr:hypothetical protein [Comamonadaceae bacterium]
MGQLVPRECRGCIAGTAGVATRVDGAAGDPRRGAAHAAQRARRPTACRDPGQAPLSHPRAGAGRRRRAGGGTADRRWH